MSLTSTPTLRAHCNITPNLEGVKRKLNFNLCSEGGGEQPKRAHYNLRDRRGTALLPLDLTFKKEEKKSFKNDILSLNVQDAIRHFSEAQVGNLSPELESSINILGPLIFEQSITSLVRHLSKKENNRPNTFDTFLFQLIQGEKQLHVLYSSNV